MRSTISNLRRTLRQVLINAFPLVKRLRYITDEPHNEPKLARAVIQLSKEAILEEYSDDPWLCNYFVNWWEYLKGEPILSSYPWNVTIPIADVCNARCTFCSAWLEGTSVISPEEVDRFAEVLRFARLIGIAGHGEPLAHPKCEEIFGRIASYTDRRSQSYIITNGVYLEKRIKLLQGIRVSTYNVSLNAATAETHDVVMGLGKDAFDLVLGSIQQIIAAKDTIQPRPFVNVSFVITRDNVHEIARFVELGNRLAVDNIYLRTLSPVSSPVPGLNYHCLPPYLHPKFEDYVAEAKEAIASSPANVITDIASWSAPVLSVKYQELINISPPAHVDRKVAIKDLSLRSSYRREFTGQTGQPLTGPNADLDIFEDGTNPFNRAAQFHCYFVYHDLIINDFNLKMIPCCYMSHVPGFEHVHFDGKQPFMSYWNSPAFVHLRKRLKEGPLFGACKKCPAQPVPC